MRERRCTAAGARAARAEVERDDVLRGVEGVVIVARKELELEAVGLWVRVGWAGREGGGGRIGGLNRV